MSRILKKFPNLTIAPQDLSGRVEFSDIFGRLAPLHIEIGSGKGTFLVNQARQEPQANFIGIEWASRYYRFAVDRAGRWNLNNVRIIRTDAAFFLAEYVPDASVDCFHIYFPDPWPKKRHHKRRFFNDSNTDQLIRCLKPEGAIRVATDFEEYFEQIKALLSARLDRLEQVDFLPTSGAGIGEWVGSNFERKYLKENRPIFTIAVKKSNEKPTEMSKKLLTITQIPNYSIIHNFYNGVLRETRAMEWTIDYLEKDKIVCVKTSGLMDWEQHKKFAEEVFPFAIKNGSHKVFIDFRDMVPDFDILQIDDLPRLLKEIGVGPGFKIAGVYDETSPHSSEFKFFKNTSYIESIEVHYFSEKDEALAWLKLTK